MKNKFKSCWLFFLFIIIISLIPPYVLAEIRVSLSPEAQKAMKRGLLELEQQEWAVAVRHFEEARKLEPNVPEIIFNLGTAESKIDGHEMRAVAFLKMYLAADPRAVNTNAVKDQIVRLEIKIKDNMGKLLTQAKEMTGQFTNEYERWNALSKTGVAQAKSGDISGAKQTAASLPGKADSYLAYIARALAEAGSVQSGKDIVSRIEGEVWKSHAYQDIAIVQAQAGDISGAQYTLISATYPGYKYNGLIAIAKAQAQAGKKQDAISSLLRAREMTAANTSSYDKEHCSEYHSIGKAQVEIGDFLGAFETANMINQADKKIFDYKANLLVSIGEEAKKAFDEKFKAGDIKGATKLAIQNPHRYSKFNSMLALKHFDICADLIDLYDNTYQWKFELYGNLIKALIDDNKPDQAREIAEKAKADINKMDPYTIATFIEALLKLNDLEGVRQAIPRIPKDSWSRNSILVSYAKALANSGKTAEARQVASEMQDGYEKTGILETIIAQQFKKGDLYGVLETAVLIKDEYYKSSAYEKVIDKHLTDKNYSEAINIAGLMPTEARRSSAYRKVAERQAKNGQMEAALKTALLINDANNRSEVYKDISYQQIQAGDFSGAKRSMEMIPGTDKKIDAYLNTLSSLQSMGYRKAVNENINIILSLIKQLNDPRQQAQYYNRLAYYSYYYSDSFAAIPQLLDLAREKARNIADAQKRSELYYSGYDSLADNFKKMGNYTALRESLWMGLDAASLMKSGSWEKRSRLLSIASLQAAEGDWLGARKTADLIDATDYRESALVTIAKAKVSAGDFRQAEEMIKEISSPNKVDEVRLEILRKQADEGKIADANKTLALIVNNSSREYGQEAIALAYLKAGNTKAAKAVIAKLKGDPGYKLFEEMTKAGELEWAYQTFAKLKSDSWKQYFLRYIADGEIKKGNLKAAKKVAEQLTDKWQQANFYAAAASAGESGWALDKADEINDDYYRIIAKSGIAKAIFKKGNIAGAKNIINALKKARTTPGNRFYYVVNPLLEMGEIEAAREQLLLVHPQDDEFEAWAAYVIAGSVPENLKKQAIAAIQDNYWKSKFLYSRALYATKDKAAMTRANAADIPDLQQRNQVYLELTRKEAKEGNINVALDWAGMISDNNYKLPALSELIFRAANRGSLNAVLPKLAGLPDGMGKAYIYIDAADILAHQGKHETATSFLADATRLVNAEPDNYRKARSLSAISRIASAANNQKIAVDTKSLAELTAGKLADADKQLWSNFQNQEIYQPVVAGKSVIKTDVAQQIKEKEAIARKLDKWRGLLGYELNKPMFLDMNGYIKTVMAKPKQWDIFSGLIEIVESSAEALKKMKALEAEK